MTPWSRSNRRHEVRDAHVVSRLRRRPRGLKTGGGSTVAATVRSRGRQHEGTPCRQQAGGCGARGDAMTDPDQILAAGGERGPETGRRHQPTGPRHRVVEAGGGAGETGTDGGQHGRREWRDRRGQTEVAPPPALSRLDELSIATKARPSRSSSAKVRLFKDSGRLTSGPLSMIDTGLAGLESRVPRSWSCRQASRPAAC